MGYWTEFGINYLEYITISEVAVVALNSILASFGFIALGSLLSHIYLGDIFKVGEGKYTQ
jgi:energy-converting hydrogenase Eha subunit E